MKRKQINIHLVLLTVLIFLIIILITYYPSKINLSPVLRTQTTTTISGSSEAIISDFEDLTSTIDYYLHNKDGIIYKLDDQANKIPDDLISGERISLKEVSISNDIITLTANSIFERKKFDTNPSVQNRMQKVHRGNINLGEQKTLVVPVYFQDEPIPTTSTQEIYTKVFDENNVNSTNAWVKEVSYQQASVVGTVVQNWQYLDGILPNVANCGVFKLKELVLPLLEQQGIDITPYNRLLIVYPKNESCGPTFNGQANVGTPKITLNGTTIALSTIVLNGIEKIEDGTGNHELGHNFGLLHANYWSCGSSPLTGNCISRNRWDGFDIMGSSYNKMHFDAFHKEKIGWLKDKNIVNYIPKEGSKTYKLEPIELPTNGIQMIKIPLSDTTYYSIEYRWPIPGTYDEAFLLKVSSYVTQKITYSGPMIHWNKIAEEGDTQLLDLNVPVYNNTDFTILPVNKTFIDNVNNIIVKTIAATPEYLEINISGKVNCGPNHKYNITDGTCEAEIYAEPTDASLTKTVIQTATNYADKLTNWNNAITSPSANTIENLKSSSPLGIVIGPSGSSFVERLPITFDTSSIPNQAIIIESSVSLSTCKGTTSNCIQHTQNYETFPESYFTLVNAPLSSPPDISLEDFGNFETNGLSGSDKINFTDISSGSKYEFILNEEGKTWINKGGYTTLGLVTGFDFTGTIPDTPLLIMISNFMSSRTPIKTDQYQLNIKYSLNPQANTCGNGIIESGEQCDDLQININKDLCDDNCELTYCGDGVVQKPNGNGTGGPLNYGYERCELNQPGCNNDCTYGADQLCSTTGGVDCNLRLEGCYFDLHPSSMECKNCENVVCENYINKNDCEADSCQVLNCYWDSVGSCKTNICGDNLLAPNEFCDSTGDVNCKTQEGYAGTTTCNAQCTDYYDCVTTEYCGDGTVNGYEQCDDGGTTNGDGCDSSCNNENFCGNGVIDAGEQCEGDNLNGKNCISEGFESGVLLCNNQCSFDYSNCNNLICGLGDSYNTTSNVCKTEIKFAERNAHFLASGLDWATLQQSNSVIAVSENVEALGLWTKINPGSQSSILRPALLFNTSFIPDSVIILSSSLQVHFSTYDNLYPDLKGYIALTSFNPTNPTSLVAEDYESFGGNIGTSTYLVPDEMKDILTFTFNESELGIVNTKGWTMVGLRTGYDIEGVFEGEENIMLSFYSGQYGFSGPVLVIKYTRCGDGVKDSEEVCDDGSSNGLPNRCNNECTGITSPICGNAQIEAGEICDENSSKPISCATPAQTPGVKFCKKGCQAYTPCTKPINCGNDTNGNIIDGICKPSEGENCVTCSEDCGSCGGGTCFLENTKISTPRGTKDIEDLKIGDKVLTLNENTNLLEEEKVTKTFKHSSNSYLIINNKLRVTSNHPMYLNNLWQKIGNAKIGDTLKTINGEETIYSIKKINKKEKVYNLEVEGNHNYYAESYLAHNKVGGFSSKIKSTF